MYRLIRGIEDIILFSMKYLFEGEMAPLQDEIVSSNDRCSVENTNKTSTVLVVSNVKDVWNHFSNQCINILTQFSMPSFHFPKSSSAAY